jgi:DNA-binding CsgD family transcriptional regulator
LQAYLRFRLAEAAAVRGDRSQAAAAAREARALVEHLGAQPLLEQIDALVRAARLALQPVPAPATAAAAGETARIAASRASGSALAGVGRNPSVGAGPDARESAQTRGNDAANQAPGATSGSASAGTSAGVSSGNSRGVSNVDGGASKGNGGGSNGSSSEVGAVGNLGLTPRELDVLRLVAEGLSNGQIGARLYITTKTVSVHVSNILAKLGVSSRTEAAAVAHRLRVFDIVA